MDEYDDSHGRRRTGGVSLGIFVFQGISEIHCPFVGRTIRTMGLAAGLDLIVPCTGARNPDCPAAPGDLDVPDKALARDAGCPLWEIWAAYEAFLRDVDGLE